MRTKQVVTSALIAVGSFAGSAAMVGAFSGNHPVHEEGGEVLRESPFPPTSPSYGLRFSGSVGSVSEAFSTVFSDDELTVQLRKGERAGAVCFVAEFNEEWGGQADGCFDAETISAGVAYAAGQNHSGPIEVFGVVPDEVGYVEIDSTTVAVVDNFWHYRASPHSTDLKFVVVSTDGTLRFGM